MQSLPPYVSKLLKDTLRRYPDMPIKTLARYLVRTHLNEVGGDIERVRHQLRYYTGTSGEDHRNFAKEKELFRTEAVKLPQSRAEARTAYDLPIGLWLILSDLHCPMHVVKAVESAVDWGKRNKVNGVLLNGDFQDCGEVAFWPGRKIDFEDEVEITLDTLDWLCKEFKGKRIIWKPGNHEDRLENYYNSHAPAIADMPHAGLEICLGLESRGITYLERKQMVMAGRLPIFHGNEFRGGNLSVNPARWLYLKAKASSACAHFHRTSEHTEVDVNDKMITCWSFGCLSDLRPDYNPFGSSWNHGFALVDIGKDGRFEVENRRILSTGKVV